MEFADWDRPKMEIGTQWVPTSLLTAKAQALEEFLLGVLIARYDFS